MTKKQIITFLKKNKENFYKKYNISKMTLFGSYAREEQSIKSDVDILYTLKEGAKFSYDKYIEFEDELKKAFDTKVDNTLKTSTLINWKNLSAMRDKISHDYRGVDESIVWSVIKEYLPKLKIALIEIIPNIQNHKAYVEAALESEYYKVLSYLKDTINSTLGKT
jgi:predicted nucleotidyltransferase